MPEPLRPFGWRTVWVLAMFDLPTETREQRKAYARFRKDLLEDGFTMMQYSVYQRHCASTENADVHVQRMGSRLPAEGEVRFLVITDKQFGKIITYWGKKRQPKPESPAQLEFF
ncbi:MAG TPA: CRISPR-associated endonuclease Cas2 [Stellaceae bacterium]|nr:CRISPR-associated endonuclease Cas2 [Stellaceae bacterium]